MSQPETRALHVAMRALPPDVVVDHHEFSVAGRWVEGETTFPVENPADESRVAEVATTPLPEIERAVVEGRRAFDEGVWADLLPAERARRVRA